MKPHATHLARLGSFGARLPVRAGSTRLAPFQHNSGVAEIQAAEMRRGTATEVAAVTHVRR
jgi:hypothetical protein